MLQLKPNRWSCSITALAMAVGVPVRELIDELGHDGSQIVFPHLPEPMCRRGFHSQELIHLAWRRGFAVTPVELFPTIRPTSGRDEVAVHLGGTTNWKRFIQVINSTMGILEGQGTRCHHAVHHRCGAIWDPDGHQYQYSRGACEKRGFFANRVFIFTDVKGTAHESAQASTRTWNHAVKQGRERSHLPNTPGNWQIGSTASRQT